DLVDRPRIAVDDHLIDIARASRSYLPVADVREDRVRVTVRWVPVAAAATGAIADHVAGAQIERDLRPEAHTLTIRIEEILGSLTRQPAEEASRPFTVAIGQDRKRCLVPIKVIVPTEAESAAILPRALRIVD